MFSTSHYAVVVFKLNYSPVEMVFQQVIVCSCHSPFLVIKIFLWFHPILVDDVRQAVLRVGNVLQI